MGWAAKTSRVGPVKLSNPWLDSPFILLFLCFAVTRTSAQRYFTLQLEALEGARKIFGLRK